MKYKKLFASCSALLVTAQLMIAQSNIQFTNGNLSAALKEAKAQNKPVFFMGYVSWCPHCNNMKQKVFTNAAVAGFLNQKFICVSQDLDKDEGIQLRQTYGVRSYPTFIFLDGDGNTLYRTVGESDTTEFLAQAGNALDPHQQLPYLKKQFEADVSNAHNCYAYLRALRRGKLDFQEVVHNYFSTQSDEQLLSNNNWKIFTAGTTDLSTRESNFVLNNLKEFTDLVPQEQVERKIASMAYEALLPLAKNGDTAAYYRSRKNLANTHLFKVDSVIFVTDIYLDEELSDWNAYKAATLQFTDKYMHDNFARLKDIAGKYLQNISDINALSNAAQWAQQALVLREDYKTCILCAKLYQKLNDKQNAVAMARRAKDIAERSGLSGTSEADKILTLDLSKK